MWASPQRTSMMSGRRCPKSFPLCRCRRGSQAPGASSRWSTERSWRMGAAAAELVVEVLYDHVTRDRFRHGTKLLRFRPDKPPRQCSIDQIVAPPTRSLPAGGEGTLSPKEAALMRDWPACDPTAGLSPPTIHRPDRSHSYHLRPRAERRLRRVRPADRDGRARFGLRTSRAFPWSHRR